MHRVFVDSGLVPGLACGDAAVSVNQTEGGGGVLVVTGEEAEHAWVRRLAVGEAVEALDGRGHVLACRVSALHPGRGKRSAELHLRVEASRNEPAARPNLTVACPAPKGDRAAMLADQLSQLGVAVWQIITTERSVVDPREHKVERLARVATSAMKQCGRAHGMVVRGPIGLSECLAAVPPGERIVFGSTEGGIFQTSSSASSSDSVLLVIGPEGGLSAAEVAAILSRGGCGVRLGPHVLRTETAAAAGAGLIMASGMSGSGVERPDMPNKIRS